jgi:acyl-CoA thioester hydrolase/1,4-dihydroxy-2-naphthoyl-CoA hydrolase
MIKLEKKINFFDCDPAGILFYGNIFFLCHSAYEELVSSFALNTDYWQNDDFVVPIINTSANYLFPYKNGDTVSVIVTVTDLRKSSFELNYECFNQHDKLCASVKTIHVLVDKKSWQKKELLPEIRESLKFHRV